MCIARFVHFYKDNLLEIVGKTTVKECWKSARLVDVFCSETPLFKLLTAP